jgi:prophage tail gpP-like protein
VSQINLNINGAVHTGWKAVQVKLSMDNLSGAFHLDITDKWGSNTLLNPVAREIKPADACTVDIEGETVITGYIDKVSPSYDSLTHGISVDGRDKAGDLVDCSIINGTGQYKGLKLEQIAQRICEPFGIPVITNIDTGKKFDTFNIEQGMTAFEAIQKMCKMRRCLAISDGKGRVLITRAGTDTASTPLLEGQNILAASADYDFTERYRQYVCKGQKQGDDNSSINNIRANKGVVTDEFVPRYRPLLVVADGQADGLTCFERAVFEAAVRRGKSRKFNVTVVGWLQADGSLWGINKLVQIESKWLGVLDTLLIAEVNFKIDQNGETTELTITSPEAYLMPADKTLSKKGGKKGDKQTGNNPYIEG